MRFLSLFSARRSASRPRIRGASALRRGAAPKALPQLRRYIGTELAVYPFRPSGTYTLIEISFNFVMTPLLRWMSGLFLLHLLRLTLPCSSLQLVAAEPPPRRGSVSRKAAASVASAAPMVEGNATSLPPIRPPRSLVTSCVLGCWPFDATHCSLHPGLYRGFRRLCLASPPPATATTAAPAEHQIRRLRQAYGLGYF